MLKRLLSGLFVLAIGTTLFAQEAAIIEVKLLKDGEVVHDTSYTYSDAMQAKQAIKLLDIMSSDEHEMLVKVFKDDAHQMVMHQSNGQQHSKLIYISEDGDIQDLEDEGQQVWVQETLAENGDSIKIVKIRVSDEIERPGETNVRNEYGNTHVIKKKARGEDGEEIIIQKELIVLSGDETESSWTVNEDDNGHITIVGEDGKHIEVFSKKGNDCEGENQDQNEWNIIRNNSSDNGNVEVIVIKKNIGDNEEEIELEVIVNDENNAPKKRRRQR